MGCEVSKKVVVNGLVYHGSSTLTDDSLASVTFLYVTMYEQDDRYIITTTKGSFN